MGNQLVEFLHSKKIHAQGPALDWQEKKAAWIHSVENLYKYVKEILHHSTSSGDVNLDEVDMLITEDFVGTYSMPKLILSVGGERVEFRPMGISVIGADGRVDIRGERDVITLLRDEANPQSEWIMVLQRVPDRKTKPLGPETLKYALEKVMLPLP